MICIGLSCLSPGGAGVAGSPAPGLETPEPNVAAGVTSTVTVTQTRYTVTQTVVTTVPAQTTTENVIVTVTATITPAPTTVCGGARPDTTVTLTRPYGIVTETDTVYSTTRTRATVWIGLTTYVTSSNQASATACSRRGGSYGADAAGLPTPAPTPTAK
ncbi:hypothetical protein GGS23DRAFT_401140 [Durotheca rogersii]|uniref:uncharacterized protein n=1 Tax=Durotheca rogersii TaxID=419775 RepID=UPI002220F374|nr:uncharacterized protein GGS23DRAFT_401140 [Durotheca rogersii]KAI5856178.1 hypothetical protein GGS23DRAFT_401140 [Durotheca rogersii]